MPLPTRSPLSDSYLRLLAKQIERLPDVNMCSYYTDRILSVAFSELSAGVKFLESIKKELAELTDLVVYDRFSVAQIEYLLKNESLEVGSTPPFYITIYLKHLEPF